MLNNAVSRIMSYWNMNIFQEDCIHWGRLVEMLISRIRTPGLKCRLFHHSMKLPSGMRPGRQKGLTPRVPNCQGVSEESSNWDTCLFSSPLLCFHKLTWQGWILCKDIDKIHPLLEVTIQCWCHTDKQRTPSHSKFRVKDSACKEQIESAFSLHHAGQEDKGDMIEV